MDGGENAKQNRLEGENDVGGGNVGDKTVHPRDMVEHQAKVEEAVKPLPGKPADPGDYIVKRRAEILRSTSGFCGTNLNLIDLGCGNGETINELENEFNLVMGIDKPPEDSLIYKGCALFLKPGDYRDDLRISLWDIDYMQPEYFLLGEGEDRVVCFEVLEHLQDDHRGCGVVCGLLRQGGLTAITVPNKWWLFETHAPWPLNRIPFLSWLPTCIHDRFARARIYTRKQIVRMVRSAGLRIEAVHWVRAPMDRLPIRWLARILRGKKHTTRIPFFATSIMVIARKEE